MLLPLYVFVEIKQKKIINIINLTYVATIKIVISLHGFLIKLKQIFFLLILKMSNIDWEYIGQILGIIASVCAFCGCFLASFRRRSYTLSAPPLDEPIQLGYKNNSNNIDIIDIIDISGTLHFNKNKDCLDENNDMII